MHVFSSYTLLITYSEIHITGAGILYATIRHVLHSTDIIKTYNYKYYI